MSERREPSLRPSTAAPADPLTVSKRSRRPRAAQRARPRRRPLLRLFVYLLIALLALTVLPVVVLRWLPPPTTAFMLQSDTTPVRYRWVARDRIAETARRAVVAAEDQKFWDHQGFDLEAMEKAYTHNRKSKR
jgi:monofunctional biosynthetic peptidoglycan transglycosylase